MLQQGRLWAAVQGVSGTPVVFDPHLGGGQLPSLLGAPGAVLQHRHHVCSLEAVVVAPAPCVWTALSCGHLTRAVFACKLQA